MLDAAIERLQNVDEEKQKVITALHSFDSTITFAPDAFETETTKFSMIVDNSLDINKVVGIIRNKLRFKIEQFHFTKIPENCTVSLDFTITPYK